MDLFLYSNDSFSVLSMSQPQNGSALLAHPTNPPKSQGLGFLFYLNYSSLQHVQHPRHFKNQICHSTLPCFPSFGLVAHQQTSRKIFQIATVGSCNQNQLKQQRENSSVHKSNFHYYLIHQGIEPSIPLVIPTYQLTSNH